MSHVDEGALHAYLDGALDEYPAAEAQHVREHLEVCSACRERLEAERGIRDRAASILGLAAPEIAVPSFEELRAYVRANAPKPSPVSVRMYRLSWAASVVLALGTGYMLRGGQVPVMPPTGGGLDQQRAQEVPAPVQTAESDAAEVGQTFEEASTAAGGSSARELEQVPAPAREVARQESAPSATSQVAAAPAAVVAPAERPSASGDTQASAAADNRANEPELPQDFDAAVAAPVGVRLDEIVATGAARRRLEDQTAVVPTTAPAADTVQAVEPGQLADAAGGGATQAERRSTSQDVITSANAAAPVPGRATLSRLIEFGARDAVSGNDDSYSLVVPGLELLDIRFRGAGPQPEGQVVLQRLESGDTLEVIHLPPEIDPSVLEDLAPGETELVVQRAAGWIVMRAPVREEALLQLLDRLLGDTPARD